MGRHGSSDHLGLWMALLLLGFLVTAGVAQERIREGAEAARAGELAEIVRHRQASIGELGDEVQALQDRLAQEQARLAGESRELRELIRRAGDLAALAAAADVHGPGVVVELTDSARTPATRQDAADSLIDDVDLQQVVNELWRGGAEAVAVNGRRISATSAIRVAGGRILVNYEAVASPYRVEAIGDPETLARHVEDSAVARRFEVWTQAYGLGFSISRAPELRIAGSGPVRELTWASPGAAS